MLIAVCSARPHTTMQRTGQKLKDPWKRDVYHLRRSGMTTLCGRDSSEWLTIGHIEIDGNCCTRCAKKAGEQ